MSRGLPPVQRCVSMLLCRGGSIWTQLNVHKTTAHLGPAEMSFTGADMLQDLNVTRHVFPIKLSDGRIYNLVGHLYSAQSRSGRTLQVAIHGASYNHSYWAVPAINGRDYSYVEFMARKGYPVLALDLLGTGESDQPDGDFLNLSETSASVHQVLSALRGAGSPIDRRFERIVLVGHSNGTLTSTRTQGVYGSADGIVATGWVHMPHRIPIPESTLGALMANPYIRTNEALRRQLFYHEPQADAAVVRYDIDSLADQIARGQLTDLFRASVEEPAQSRSRDVKVPILIQLGDYDVLAPSAMAAAEAQFFSRAAAVAVQTLSDTGHCFNTHLTNRQSWDGIAAWLAAHFGC